MKNVNMKRTAIAPANIAFIKYWGKADDILRLPLHDSFSMNISGAYTTTTVEFDEKHIHDEIDFIGETVSEKEKERIKNHLDLIRKKAGRNVYAKIVTKNSFPKGTGIASSASGFAALTVASASAIGLSLRERELSIFARLSSGSACRSIPDGFVRWYAGKTSEESFAKSVYPSTYWDVRDILIVVSSEMKKIPTSDGMKNIKTSPGWKERVEGIDEKIKNIIHACEEKDFLTFGNIIEDDCLSMHRVMQTQNPPLHYWTQATKDIMNVVHRWRKNGLPVYFTIDAGPNIHLICEGKNEKKVLEKIQILGGVQSVIVNKPTIGAHIIDTDLF